MSETRDINTVSVVMDEGFLLLNRLEQPERRNLDFVGVGGVNGQVIIQII